MISNPTFQTHGEWHRSRLNDLCFCGLSSHMLKFICEGLLLGTCTLWRLSLSLVSVTNDLTIRDSWYLTLAACRGHSSYFSLQRSYRLCKGPKHASGGAWTWCSHSRCLAKTLSQGPENTQPHSRSKRTSGSKGNLSFGLTRSRGQGPTA
jgi:hypothetical protein